MTESDADTIVAILCAEDVAHQEHTARLHALAAMLVREAPSAETRTAARLEMLRLEKGMVR